MLCGVYACGLCCSQLPCVLGRLCVLCSYACWLCCKHCTHSHNLLRTYVARKAVRVCSPCVCWLCFLAALFTLSQRLLCALHGQGYCVLLRLLALLPCSTVHTAVKSLCLAWPVVCVHVCSCTYRLCCLAALCLVWSVMLCACTAQRPAGCASSWYCTHSHSLSCALYGQGCCMYVCSSVC